MFNGAFAAVTICADRNPEYNGRDARHSSHIDKEALQTSASVSDPKVTLNQDRQ